MFDLKSINEFTIIPAVMSTVNSRKECNPYYEDGMLPLFTAPMASTINEDNYKEYLKVGIKTVIPRNISLEVRIKLLTETFVALSLDEFESIFGCPEYTFDYPTYVCVDIANGHMKRLIDSCAEVKRLHGDKVTIMTGNIAHPDTYYLYAKAGIDYIRCGIGSGNVCFVKGTDITLANGTKKSIENVKQGDMVKTKNGDFKVLNNFKKHTSSILKINNQVECTPDHEFFVVDKDKAKYVTEDTIHEYGYYVKASELSVDKHLLVKQFT